MNYTFLAVLLVSVCASSVITHSVDEGNYAKRLVAEQESQMAHEKKVVSDQAKIAQQKQGERDAIQNRYNAIAAQYNGVRKQLEGELSKQYPAVAVPSQGFRVHEQDAGVLSAFARDCEITELERNEVIEKYNSLIPTV